MQRVIAGYRAFQADVFQAKRPLFESLRDGQQPDYLFISCADSRVVPHLLTQTDAGELFTLENAGNIVPPHGARAGGEAATIEYAVKVLKVKNIIVCGHSHCGAMKGLLAPESLSELPAVAGFLQWAEAARQAIDRKYPGLEGEERLEKAVEENVLVQLENLKTHPAVAEALGRSELVLQGWVYTFETGQVRAFDPASGRFDPL